ncbi:ABC transporter transmembrane domain-containing protein [Streptomyces sp. NPDC087294]|uniref:ABC transporter transmembrane domain-containing protein n=1 Tax=Streptomyces sp. NPDC087294 TaxID=3365777 RepID=UPI00380CED4B
MAAILMEHTEQGVIRWAFRCRRRWIVGATVFTALHQVCEAAVPVGVGLVIDHAIRDGSPLDLLAWLAALGAFFLVLTTVMRLGGRCNRRASQGAAHLLRMAAVERVLDPRGFAHRTDPGTLLSTVTNDALRIGLGNRFWALAGGALAALLAGAAWLLATSVPLGLLVLACLVPLLVALRLFATPLSARSGTEQAQVARATGTAADLVLGLRVLKGLGAEAAALRRYRTASRASLAATVRVARWEAGYESVTLLLNAVFLAAIAWAGARFAAEGTITVGQFVAAVGLARFLVGPSERLGAALALRARARGSARRFAALLDEPYAVQDNGGELPRPRGDMALRGIVHGALRGVDLTVPAGQVVGIATGDPAAAADLLDLLALRAVPEQGTVALDDTDLTAAGPTAAHRAVLVADHDGDLFDGTVAENVAAALLHARPDGEDAADPARRPPEQSASVVAAMAAAAADDVVRAGPDGDRATIGERGRFLSGGQRQRVALARALAADPPVLVLHEPTTAVDAATEAAVAAGLHRLREGRTTLLVTTSPILLRHCDRVLFLADGRVRAEGTHARLTDDEPAYRTVVMA